MAVSRARSVARSRWAWFSYPLPAAFVAWLSNDVPACRGLAGAWLIRGARAPSGIPGMGRARHGRYPRSKTGRRVFPMVAVMIGIDPHKASHTAVAIDPAEVPLGQLRVRACAAQAERLLAWAQAWPQRTRAVRGAGGVGHLLARQLAAAGERVLDVPPKLAARVRLLATGNINKNDPDDARSVAVAALRSAGVREVRRDDHAAVLKVWSERYRDLGRARTHVACRLHQVLRADPRRRPRGDHRRPGGANPGIDHPGGGGAGRPLGARRRAHRRPARHRCADPPGQDQARRSGPGRRDQPDRAVRR